MKERCSKVLERAAIIVEQTPGLYQTVWTNLTSKAQCGHAQTGPIGAVLR